MFITNTLHVVLSIFYEDIYHLLSIFCQTGKSSSSRYHR